MRYLNCTKYLKSNDVHLVGDVNYNFSFTSQAEQVSYPSLDAQKIGAVQN